MNKNFFEWLRIITPIGIALLGWLIVSNVNQFRELINFRFNMLDKEITEIKQITKEHIKDGEICRIRTEHRLTYLEEIVNGRKN